MARNAAMLAMIVLMAACTTSNGGNPTGPSGAGGHYKVGNPYQIKGKWYYPAVDEDYDQTGIASWYGPNFHGKPTANGERFDMNRLSAAHKTLPLPSFVEVSNLENGRSMVLRVNDRGPFANNRIIDLSRAAASELGFKDQGLAQVRVRYVGPAPVGDLPPRQGQRTTRSEPLPAAAATPALPKAADTPTSSDIGEFIVDLDTEAASYPIPAAGPRGYEIEVIDLRRLDDASIVEMELSAIAPLYVSRVGTLEEGVYRITMGPFATFDSAEVALLSVVDAGYHGARLIPAP